jgi:hypothetical protein
MKQLLDYQHTRAELPARAPLDMSGYSLAQLCDIRDGLHVLLDQTERESPARWMFLRRLHAVYAELKERGDAFSLPRPAPPDLTFLERVRDLIRDI